MKGKNKGKRMMFHPTLKKNRFVKPEDVQSFLDQGYVFGMIKRKKP